MMRTPRQGQGRAARAERLSGNGDVGGGDRTVSVFQTGTTPTGKQVAGQRVTNDEAARLPRLILNSGWTRNESRHQCPNEPRHTATLHHTRRTSAISRSLLMACPEWGINGLIGQARIRGSPRRQLLGRPGPCSLLALLHSFVMHTTPTIARPARPMIPSRA